MHDSTTTAGQRSSFGGNAPVSGEADGSRPIFQRGSRAPGLLVGRRAANSLGLLMLAVYGLLGYEILHDYHITTKATAGIPGHAGRAQDARPVMPALRAVATLREETR